MTTERETYKTISEVIETCAPQLKQSTELTAKKQATQSQITTIQRYGSFDNFREVFSPIKQVNYCVPEQWERCCCGKAPTLAEVGKIYDNGSPKKWLIEQLYELTEYCGCREKFSENQYYTLAGMIFNSFYYLKVTEIMLFLYLFKTGKYGHFYGYTDPMTIFQSLDSFVKNDRREIRERKEEREREQRLSSEVKLTRAQWEKIKETLPKET